MPAAEIAALLKEGGPWGIVALLCVLAIYLHKGWQSCQEARLADAKVSAEALSKQASTNAELASALHTLRDGQTEVMRVVSIMQRDVEHDDERGREALGTLATRVSELAGRIDMACRGAGK